MIKGVGMFYPRKGAKKEYQLSLRLCVENSLLTSDDAFEFDVERSVISFDSSSDWNVPLVIRNPD
jgi:hypothetical protein